MPYKVEISAETIEQAQHILDRLLKKRLVTGGQFIQAPARFLWKQRVIDMDYVTVTSFTIEAHKQAIIDIAEEASAEEVPMICFFPFEANPTLDSWIRSTVGAQTPDRRKDFFTSPLS